MFSLHSQTACLLDSRFPSTVKRIVMMGGTVNGTGNKAPAAEANIHNDPDAAKIVFNSFKDITMAGLNVTHQVSLSTGFRAAIRKAGGVVGEYIHSFTKHYIDVLQSWGNTEFSVHDSSAVRVRELSCANLIGVLGALIFLAGW